MTELKGEALDRAGETVLCSGVVVDTFLLQRKD